ncbi:MAG: ExbD/TolR family protein [Cyanophyceae cyanobacterium]
MRFKSDRRQAVPTIDLIPMLNVMMSVLAFFVLVSTLLATAPLGFDVILPTDEATPQEASPLLVTLNTEQILLGEQSVDRQQLEAQMQAYLATNPDGAVILVAEPDVPYERVIQLLAEMRQIGGERVSLGIESQ